MTFEELYVKVLYPMGYTLDEDASVGGAERFYTGSTGNTFSADDVRRIAASADPLSTIAKLKREP